MAGFRISSLTRAPFSRELSLPIVLAGVLLPALAHAAENPTLAIKVDQVGYPVDGPKIALVTLPSGPAAPSNTTFQLRRSSDNAVVFAGKLSAPEADADSGDQVQAADFSGFHKAGSYYVEIPGVGRSWNFS